MNLPGCTRLRAKRDRTGIATRPADADAEEEDDDTTPQNSISQIRIHPSGRFLYTANRGHDSIASFTVDGVTGNLTPSGWAEAERRPLFSRPWYLAGVASLCFGNARLTANRKHTNAIKQSNFGP